MEPRCCLFLACDFDDAAPAAFIDELRWHLGLDPEPPAVPTLPVAEPRYPLFDPSGDSLWTAGNPVALLDERARYRTENGQGDAFAVWGLLLRVEFRGGLTGDALRFVAWLVGQCVTEGWIGQLSTRLSDDPMAPPDTHFFAAARQPYRGRSGQPPEPCHPGAPPYPYHHTW